MTLTELSTQCVDNLSIGKKSPQCGENGESPEKIVGVN